MTTDIRTTFDELSLDVREAEAGKAEELALLAKAGLEQPPTAEEAKALLDARRAEIRHAVLTEADKRDWCVDGTRAVCANLRLERPGERTSRTIEVEFTVKMAMEVAAYTEEGAAQRLFNRGVLSQTWLHNQLYAKELAVTPLAVTIDNKPVNLPLIEADQKPEVSA